MRNSLGSPRVTAQDLQRVTEVLSTVDLEVLQTIQVPLWNQLWIFFSGGTNSALKGGSKVGFPVKPVG